MRGIVDVYECLCVCMYIYMCVYMYVCVYVCVPMSRHARVPQNCDVHSPKTVLEHFQGYH